MYLGQSVASVTDTFQPQRAAGWRDFVSFCAGSAEKF
jgi:hypothetical protein